MQNSQFISQIGENAIFQFDQQFLEFKKIDSITDYIDGETSTKTVTKLISYSVDNGETWSSWIIRNTDPNIGLPVDKDINIRLGYEVSGTSSNAVIEVSLPKMDVTYTKNGTSCCCLCESSIVNQLFYNGVNLEGTSLITGNTIATYDPYADLQNETLFYQSFNQEIAQVVGITVLYWRVTPQKRSGDIIFREWTISSKEPYKCVKVVLDSNTFPDSKVNFNIWGLDYEFPLEVQIDKASWDSIFPGTMPQEGDVLYFEINNRIYQINSSYLWRGFMAVPLYYKCTLTKYQPLLSDNSDKAIKDDLRQFTKSTDDIFGEVTLQEELKLTKPLQYEAATIQSDPVRKLIDRNLVIEETPIMNDWSLVSKFQYNLSGSVGTAIEYHQQIDFQNERSFSCWFRPKLRTDTSVYTNNYINTNGLITIYTNLTSSLKKGQLLEVKNQNQTTEVVMISDIKDNVSFSYLGSNNPSNYRKIFRDNLISGSRSGFEVNIFDNKIEIWLSGVQYLMPWTFEDDWYSLIVNSSNAYSQLTLNLWQRSIESKNQLSKFNDGSTILKMLSEKIWSIQPFAFSTTDTWKLLASETKITNIRIFNQLAEREKQSLLLNQNIIKDSQYVLLADNALPRLDIITVSSQHQ